MSGPPQGHLCGKTLLHTRGFGLKIVQPNQQEWRSTTLYHQQTSEFQSQLTPTSTKRQQSQAN